VCVCVCACVCVRVCVYDKYVILRSDFTKMTSCIITKLHMSIDTWDMGWLRLVGSMKLQVSFAKEPYKRDYILQKTPIICSILLTVTNLYSKNDIMRNYEIRHETWDMRHGMWDVGWLRLAGSIKLEVSFAKEPNKRDYILQKRPIMYIMCLMRHGSWDMRCGVATISRLLQIIGLFCRISSLL